MKDEAIEAEEFGVPGNYHPSAAVSTMCDISDTIWGFARRWVLSRSTADSDSTYKIRTYLKAARAPKHFWAVGPSSAKFDGKTDQEERVSAAHVEFHMMDAPRSNITAPSTVMIHFRGGPSSD